MPPAHLAPERISETTSQDEHSPLLTSDRPTERQDNGGRSSLVSQLLPVSLAILTLIIVESGAMLQGIPLNQVLEDIICRNFYAKNRLGGPPLEENCKNNRVVQGELAILRGWQATFDLIPGEPISPRA